VRLGACDRYQRKDCPIAFFYKRYTVLNYDHWSVSFTLIVRYEITADNSSVWSGQSCGLSLGCVVYTHGRSNSLSTAFIVCHCDDAPPSNLSLHCIQSVGFSPSRGV
jgi:hypothetical protein